MTKSARIPWDEYYMEIAQTVAKRSNCLRRDVGALIVLENGIVSTGYNGTPFGIKNCNDGGCPRCSSNALTHTGYDNCICVHAEQNALLLAAKRGIAINKSSIYVTLRPCLNCLVYMIQAGICEIVYEKGFAYGEEKEEIYHALVNDSHILFRQLEEGKQLEELDQTEEDFVRQSPLTPPSA